MYIVQQVLQWTVNMVPGISMNNFKWGHWQSTFAFERDPKHHRPVLILLLILKFKKSGDNDTWDSQVSQYKILAHICDPPSKQIVQIHSAYLISNLHN